MVYTQMNVRIEEDIKRNGDAAFAQIGLSPSQAARAVWGYAAAHIDEPQKLTELIPFEGAVVPASGNTPSTAHYGVCLVDNYLQSLGLNRDALANSRDIDSLMEEAYLERYNERGLS